MSFGCKYILKYNRNQRHFWDNQGPDKKKVIQLLIYDNCSETIIRSKEERFNTTHNVVGENDGTCKDG